MNLTKDSSLAEIVNAIADLPHPTYPTKPSSVNMGKTPAAIRQYADELEAWERDLAAYNEGRNEYVKAKAALEEIYMEKLRSESSLNHATFSIVYGKAWGDSHGGGYIEVYNTFMELEAFAERIIEANKETK